MIRYPRQAANPNRLRFAKRQEPPARQFANNLSFVLRFDLHKHTGRHLDAVDGLNGADRRFADVDDALMSAHFELFPRFLIDVGTTQNRIPLDAGRSRNRTMHFRTGPFGLLGNLTR